MIVPRVTGEVFLQQSSADDVSSQRRVATGIPLRQPSCLLGRPRRCQLTRPQTHTGYVSVDLGQCPSVLRQISRHKNDNRLTRTKVGSIYTPLDERDVRELLDPTERRYQFVKYAAWMYEVDPRRCVLLDGVGTDAA